MVCQNALLAIQMWSSELAISFRGHDIHTEKLAYQDEVGDGLS